MMADIIVEAEPIEGSIPIAAILSEKYPDLEWVLKGNTYDGLEVLNGEKPPYEDLAAFAVEVQAIVDARKVEQDKLDAYAQKYSLQQQIIVTGRAVLMGETGPLKEMLDYLGAL